MDNIARNSPFKILSPNGGLPVEETPTGEDYNYAGIREVGIRLRLMPIADAPQLTLTAGYSFVPNHEEAVKEHLVADRNTFDLNIAYYIGVNDNESTFYYFLLRGTAYQKGTLEINDQPFYDSSVSAFIVQRLGQVVIYPGLSYGLTYKPPVETFQNRSLLKIQEQVLGIFGAQYQPYPGLSFNISTAIPFLLERPVSFVREVRSSYSFVSIGGRVLF